MADVNLSDIKLQADAFFAGLISMVQVKDNRIAELEKQLKLAQEALNGVIEVRSDFALLKERTISKAAQAVEDIQATLDKK